MMERRIPLRRTVPSIVTGFPTTLESHKTVRRRRRRIHVKMAKWSSLWDGVHRSSSYWTSIIAPSSKAVTTGSDLCNEGRVLLEAVRCKAQGSSVSLSYPQRATSCECSCSYWYIFLHYLASSARMLCVLRVVE
jgi:hypothetical protein